MQTHFTNSGLRQGVRPHVDIGLAIHKDHIMCEIEAIIVSDTLDNHIVTYKIMIS